MSCRDVDTLKDIIRVLERACGFPIANRDRLESTDYLEDVYGATQAA